MRTSPASSPASAPTCHEARSPETADRHSAMSEQAEIPEEVRTTASPARLVATSGEAGGAMLAEGLADDPRWYERAVFYDIAPRGYYDSNGDGIGDIPGIIAKLDYLAWLGVDCLWLLPY